MLGEFTSFAISALVAVAPPLTLVEPAYRTLRAAFPEPPRAEVVYKADERAVTNWRGEASRHLDLDEPTAAGFAAGGDPRFVPRCVKLNNYWCIKGAGWNGMVAADPEGHAAFASAPEGAAVAALLLRRYYLDFSRRSAQAIVSRWAPAQCGFIAARPARAPSVARGAPGMAQSRKPLGPDPDAGSHLTTHGLGNTLRARYLALRGLGPRLAKAGARRTGLRRSVVADRTPPMLRTPTIALGVSALDIPLPPSRPMSLLGLAATVTSASFAPTMSCTGDSVRIRNYAMKMIDGVVSSPDEDLKLFESDGTPSERLARVLFNMASVEIGPMKAMPTLVQDGIDIAVAATKLAAEANAARAAASEAPDTR